MDDEGRCEAVDHEHGTRCVLPAGHPGHWHSYVAELPAELGPVVAQLLDSLETERELMRVAKVHYEKAARASRSSFFVFLVAIVFYLGLIGWNLFT